MAVQDRYISVNQNTTINGNAIDIRVFYEEAGTVQLSFFVPVVDVLREGVSVRGGDLAYTFQNITALFEINNNGDLIVNDIDPTIYNINAAGDLILTV